LNPVLEISVENVLPEAGAILVQQGVPEQIGGGDELLALAKRARDELAATLAPIGVVAEVTKEEFAGIYCGQGLNDSRTPLELIFPLAEKMALFAVTCGQGVGDRIRELFNAHDYPLLWLARQRADGALCFSGSGCRGNHADGKFLDAPAQIGVGGARGRAA
jgi:hypothetical protein